MVLKHKHIGIVLLTALVLGNLPACTWRQMGCAAGGAVAMAGVLAWINDYNQDRKKRGKSGISAAERNALTVCATGIGCLLGSELAGRTAEYVSIKRAEYRAEAAQLESDIQHIEESMTDIDDQLAWLDNQSKQLSIQATNVRNLPVGKEYMAGELKKASAKRKADIDLIEKNLLTTKEDTQFLHSITTNAEQKEKLEQNLRALNERLATTRKVRDNILAADAAVAYL